jgi:hypothetical protein
MPVSSTATFTPAPEHGLSSAPTASTPHACGAPGEGPASAVATGSTSFMGRSGATIASGARRARAASPGVSDVTSITAVTASPWERRGMPADFAIRPSDRSSSTM